MQQRQKSFALLKLIPVMVDVDPVNFNTAREHYEPYITDKTRVIVPVHLFGQASHMDSIMELAKEHNLYVVEDNAQAIGCDYYHEDGTISKLGTIGHIGCTSFFPSKNLGCFGDGVQYLQKMRHWQKNTNDRQSWSGQKIPS